MKKLLLILLCLPMIGFGQGWERTNGPYGGEVFTFFKNGNDIFTGGIGGIFYTNNEGDSWDHIFDSDSIFDIKKHNNLLIAGSDTDLYISNDNGLSWNISNNGLLGDQVYCIESNSNDIFVGTTQGVYKSVDSGLTWTYSSIGIPVTKINDFEITGSDIFCATNSGVYKSTNNGLTWSLINSLPAITSNMYNSPIKLASSSNGIYVVLKAKGLFFSNDSGISWNDISPIMSNNPIVSGATLCINNGVLYLGTNSPANWNGGGHIYTSNDNGVTWVNEVLTNNSNAIDIYGNNIYVSSYEGVLKSVISTGYYWENIGMGVANKVNALISKNGILHAGTDAGVYYSSDDGNTWLRAKYNFAWAGSAYPITPTYSQAPVAQRAHSMIYNGNTILTNAGIWGGKGACRSIDGVNYTKSNTNLTPISANVFTTRAVAFHNNNFYIDDWNGLYKSSSAAAWSLVNGSFQLQSAFTSMSSSYPVLYATSNGDVYISTDDGVNFTLSNTNGGDILYAQGGDVITGGANIGMFYSDNYGSSWVGIGSFGVVSFIKFNSEYFISGGSQIYKFSNLSNPNYLSVSVGLEDCNYTSDFTEHNGSLYSSTSQSCILYNGVGVFKYNPNLTSTYDFFEKSDSRSLIRVVDILGRATKGAKNEVLFYIYDDGTVEKKIVIE